MVQQVETEQERMDGTRSVVDLNGDTPNAAYERQVTDWGFIRFQCGPVKERGLNGTTIEAVIELLEERVRGFQRGPMACAENVAVLTYLQLAREQLQARTAARGRMGVEGTNIPHTPADVVADLQKVAGVTHRTPVPSPG